jgi:predicted CoA-substrate-specific enzyme activase
VSGYGAGIDSGSSFCKGALVSSRGIEALVALAAGWDIAKTGERVLAELGKARKGARPVDGSSPVDGAIPVAATGYGRARIAGCAETISEISAHAAGAAFLCPGVRTVIDIGGQDCKVIAVEDGRARDFQMNDKCAAGSGRFLELIRARLGADPAAMEELLAKGRRAALNSTCVVFAESEVIGMLARGVSREEILGGAAASLAARVASLAARLPVAAPAVLSGGLAESAGIARALSEALDIEVRPLHNGLYSGAIGAALRALHAPARGGA